MSAWKCGGFALSLGLMACGGEEGDRVAGDGGVEHADAAQFVGCPSDIPPFALGLSTASPDGSLVAVLRAASHAPPVRFLNDWTVEFIDAQGTAQPAATLREARAFMPVHGHYGTPDPRLTRHADQPAVFDIDALNLFMRGPWEVRLTVASPNSGDAMLVFRVCVEE